MLRFVIFRPLRHIILVLINPLKIPVFLLVGLAVFLWAMTLPDVGYPQETAEDPTVFAPGSTGGIALGFEQKLREADETAEELRKRLKIQEADDFGVTTDFGALRKRALNNPRVRALLGADTENTQGGAPDQGPRWGDAKVWVLASFSMPDEALRALMSEATRYGVPVVMRGFVENSVFATRDRLLDVFGSDENIQGFSIDPTLFSRFDVVAVPTFIAVDGSLEPCETPDCEADAKPPHDKLAGNVPLLHALEWIARAPGAEAREAAVSHLMMGDR